MTLVIMVTAVIFLSRWVGNTKEPERQRREFDVLFDAMTQTYGITDKKEIRAFFNQLRQEFLDWHGIPYKTPEFYAQGEKVTQFYKNRAAQKEA